MQELHGQQFPFVLPGIGMRALGADTGKIIGPVKLENGYSVFTLLGRKLPAGKSPRFLDSVRVEIRRELLREKVRSRLNGFVASAAKRYRVTIYYDRVKKMSFTPVNMVTRRLIGFGGSMIAVPPLNPLWEWIGETRGIRKVLP